MSSQIVSAFYLKRKLIWATDKKGVHYVVDAHWQEYLANRPKVQEPFKVRLFDSLHDLKKNLLKEGVVL